MKSFLIIIAPYLNDPMPDKSSSKEYRAIKLAIHNLAILIMCRILRRFPNFPNKPMQIVYAGGEKARLITEAINHQCGSFLQLVPELSDLTTVEKIENAVKKLIEYELLDPSTTVVILPESDACALATKLAGCDVQPITEGQFYAIPQSGGVEIYGPGREGLEPNVVLPRVKGEPEKSGGQAIY